MVWVGSLAGFPRRFTRRSHLSSARMGPCQSKIRAPSSSMAPIGTTRAPSPPNSIAPMGTNRTLPNSMAPMGTNRALPNSMAPMGIPRALPNPIAPIDKLTSDVRFRVLVIGRANAGKTSILQRVCDTTESPKIYRGGEEVCGPNVCSPVWSHRRPGYTQPDDGRE
jgi:hypothetical protein